MQEIDIPWIELTKPEEEKDSSNRIKRFLKNLEPFFKVGGSLLKILLIVLVLFIFVEIVSFFLVKVYFLNVGGDLSDVDIYSPEDKDWVVQEYTEENGLRFEYIPYVGYRKLPNYKGTYVTLDERAIRKTTNPCSKEDSLKVFVFGGSTIWGSRSRDIETIPSYLSQNLCSREIDVEVTNFGEAGYVSTQEVILLQQELIKGNNPDIVIFYDGGNDVFSSYQNNEAGVPQNTNHRKEDFNSRNRLNLGNYLLKTNFMKIVRNLLPKNTLALELKEGLDLETTNVYLTNVKIVKSLEKDFNFKSFFYWHPVVFTKELRSEYEQNRISDEAIPMFQPPRDFYIEVNNQIIAKNQVRDLSKVFDGHQETIFLDWIHISGKGNRIIAQEISKDIESYLKNGYLEEEWVIIGPS